MVINFITLKLNVRYLSRHPVTAVTRAYDPTADQKIVGSGNEDGTYTKYPITSGLCERPRLI